jgi:hypothetical protein
VSDEKTTTTHMTYERIRKQNMNGLHFHQHCSTQGYRCGKQENLLPVSTCTLSKFLQSHVFPPHMSSFSPLYKPITEFSFITGFGTGSNKQTKEKGNNREKQCKRYMDIIYYIDRSRCLKNRSFVV